MQAEGLLARCGVNTHAAGCLALATRGAAYLEVSPLLHIIRVCLYVCRVPDNKACTHLGHALDALNLPGAEETAEVCCLSGRACGRLPGGWRAQRQTVEAH